MNKKETNLKNIFEIELQHPPKQSAFDVVKEIEKAVDDANLAGFLDALYLCKIFLRDKGTKKHVIDRIDDIIEKAKGLK